MIAEGHLSPSPSFTSPPPCPSPRRRRPGVSATSKQFEYSRASPSVRWPDLRIQGYAPVLPTPKPSFSFDSNPKDAKVDEDSRIGEVGDDEEVKIEEVGMEKMERRSGRTRMKKMTKLALKRARDWRQRVQFLTEKILSLDSGKFVADVIDEREVQMTPTDYCFVVKQVGRVSWQRALEVYEWLNLRRWYSPNARMVATILSVLGRAQQVSLAEEVFGRATSVDSLVESDHAAASVQVYNAMMGVHARSGRFGKVQELIEVMKKRGCEPDLVSFNTLINARAKSGHMSPGSALELLREVRSSGLQPDTITYNTLISACSHRSNLEEAVRVYEDMNAARCQPDLWTYNAMISVYGRRGRTVEAERLFDELRRIGFSPDAVTYNSLLYAFASEGNAKEVDRICNKMVSAGFRKDEITYNTIIHMYGKQGRHDLALQTYKDMKSAGCTPDAVTYTVLIDSLGKADCISEAANLMSEMVDLGIRPTLMTYTALICGYATVGMRDEAEKTFDHMVKSGIEPDNQVYSIVLDVVLRAGDTRKAMVLYRDMIQKGFKPDEGLYQVMVRVFAKDTRNEDVEDLVNDMARLCSMNPKSISSILVKAEFFDLGAKMLKEAILQGEEADRDTLSSILNAYDSSGKQEEACALLDFLREHASGYQYLIAESSILMLCKKGQPKAALEEYNKLENVGFHFIGESCSLYKSLITCCEEAGFFPEACRLFSDMRFHGLKPCQDIRRSVIKIYCKMGFPETAHHLLDEAEREGFPFNDLSPHVALIETYGKLKLLQRAESLVGKLRLQRTVKRKVWNALIYAYAESGQYEQARAVFNTMMKDGPSPTVESVNGLLQALIVDGRLSETYVIVEELQDMDFKISKSTILLMLDAFARAGNIFEVKKIYNGMKAAGYLPSMHLYRSMVGLLSHGKRVRDVESMITEMEQAGFKPDLSIFNSQLKMYTGIEDFRKAANVYQKIHEAGFEADEETYNNLILMYNKDRRPEEGLSLLSEMKSKGIEPKLDTYKSLLAACGKDHLLEQAEELFEMILSKGGKLDRFVYHTMLKIYRDSGNHSKGESVLFQMKEAGLKPTIATMHMLMDSYSTGGQPQEAENVLDNLRLSGLDLSTLPYSSVIDAYLKSGDHKMAVKILLEMREDGVEPDHRIWTCFIRGAGLCHQTKEAISLLQSLCDTGFDLPIRLLTGKAELLVIELDNLVDQIGSEDNASFNFVNALEDLLWSFERRATASWVFQLAIKKGIYRHNVFRVADKDWGADFRKMSAGAALVGLTLWLDHMQDASLQGLPESPKSVVLITGTAEYHMVSLNKTLKAYLWEMGSPFLPCKTRTGLLVAKAHSLRMWLKESSFCMDLELKDAPSLPESNSMQLTEGYFMRAGLVPAFKDIHERLGQVTPKKFAKLALLSDEKREKVITADIEGTKQKLEKMMKKRVSSRARKPTRLRTAKIMRRQHKMQAASG